jgi:hypothetical protein
MSLIYNWEVQSAFLASPCTTPVLCNTLKNPVFPLDSTSYVVIELCDESSSVTKVGPPLLTAGLSNIRLQLTTPQLASVSRADYLSNMKKVV